MSGATTIIIAILNMWVEVQYIYRGVQHAQPFYVLIICIQQRACPEAEVHQSVRYTEGSAAWVLIASIIVFFMVDGKKNVY